MENHGLTFESYHPDHYLALRALMRICYAKSAEPYTEEELRKLSELYPKGQIVCLLDGELIGAYVSRIVPYARYSQPHTQANCVDMSRFAFDAENGDAVYGLDVFVNPAYQNLKIGKQLAMRMAKYVFEDNFCCIIGISRVVSFPAHMHEMDCETYVRKVKTKEIYDNALSFHLSTGAEFVAVSPNFSADDVASAGYGVVLRIPNLNFESHLPIYPKRELIKEGRILAGLI